jgi:hypothetical protein
MHYFPFIFNLISMIDLFIFLCFHLNQVNFNFNSLAIQNEERETGFLIFLNLFLLVIQFMIMLFQANSDLGLNTEIDQLFIKKIKIKIFLKEVIEIINCCSD